MKIILVYNPNAGHGKSKKVLPQVEALFNEYAIEFDLFLTDYPQHAIDIVKNIEFESYDGIVAAGGDGTLFEVLNGYFKNKSVKRIPLGIIPVGTGNSFSLDLDLGPEKWREAVEKISKKQIRKVDVAHFTSHGQDYYYLNIIGVGFVADVNQTASHFKVLGNLAYTIGIFYQLLFLKTNQYHLELDGEDLDIEATFIEVSNSKYTADFLMAPRARFDDGLLDVTILKKAGRIKLIRSFPSIFTGEHIKLDVVDTFQAKKIKIDANVPKVLTPDGEQMGLTPIEIECLHHAIEVFS